MTNAKKTNTKIPTPLVLAIASGMLSVGALAFFAPRFLEKEEPVAAELPPTEPPPIFVDDSTPEGVAEAFLDAWRKRAHADAIRLSVGDARAESEARAARDAELDPTETAAAAPWQKLAANRLRLEVKQRDVLAGGSGVRLRTEAAGEFFGGPYRRSVEFEVRRTDDGFRVSAIRFGDVLEAPPAIREKQGPT
jgi:hypothetical protein